MAGLQFIFDALRDRPHEIVPFMVVLLPLLGFVVLSLFGAWIKREGESSGAGLLACGTVLISFGLSVWTVVSLVGLTPGPGALRFTQPYLGLDWIDVGGFRVPFSLLIDPLSSVMMLVVTGVGSLIHVYSLGYMAHDEELVRYFSYLNLFTFFMLLLVTGGNLPLLFIGWEGVGLCSYLLIGFWFKKKSASDAGKKAFIVNRIGDVGLILGMTVAFHAFGTLDLVDLTANAGSLAREALGEVGVVTAVCLLLFVGACGKSAQVPLHVWLPDAMEGPTPVSALIHAATMVTAGVYLVARLAPLYSLSATAMAVVATVGAVTALMAAGVALVQTDIKKVLAYSTISQLGYMFLACGVGAFGVGVFHLYTHAFFKALLFLGSGSVIHALSGEQDMRRMGGLRRLVPWTFGTFLIGTLAIAGIPPLAGFFSKDEILLAAWNAHRYGLFAVALLTALLTAFYMSRLLFLTFFGAYRGPLGGHGNAGHADAAHAGSHGHAGGAGSPDHHAGGIHESPWSMLLPLLLLAIGSTVAGFVQVPELIHPAFRLEAGAHLKHATWLPYLATLTSLIGIVLAYYLYLQYTELPGRIAAGFSGVRRMLEAKYGFDTLFDWIAARVVVGGSTSVLWKRVDDGVIDGAVNGGAGLVHALALAARTAQTGLVRGYALLILGGAVTLLGYLLWGR